jgi:MoaA/NifB/PqqE/SkfB family radical SAM enzyme
VKLALHPEFSAFVEGERVYPINVEFSPTHVCQAACPWCFYAGTHEKMAPDSIADFDMAINLIHELRQINVKALTWTGGGEPTLHPRFPQLVEEANRCGLCQGMFTNALSLPKYEPSLFKWIRVSNTDHPWNEKALALIRDRVGVMGLAVNYVGDDKAIQDALVVGHRIHADYVQVRQALNLRGLVTERPPPRIDDPLLMVTLYKFADSPNPHGYSKCYGFHFVPFVWHDGDVDVCGYLRKRGMGYTLGNLKQKRLKVILDEAPRHVPVCSNCQVCCKNHEINKLVNAALAIQNLEFV